MVRPSLRDHQQMSDWLTLPWFGGKTIEVQNPPPHSRLTVGADKAPMVLLPAFSVYRLRGATRLPVDRFRRNIPFSDVTLSLRVWRCAR